jgi:glucose 1-dehydrogenase
MAAESTGDLAEAFGPLDVLVNNAGIEQSAPLLETDAENWDHTIAVDLKGPFLCLQAAARRMQEHGGSIVNISSIHEDFPFPDHAPYVTGSTYNVDGGYVRHAEAL